MNDNLELATFGAGCFWCVEGVFQRLKGVVSVIPGYSGGHVNNPSYEEVCTGNTGHAEVAQIQFNPDDISFNELLEVFFGTHDPTTLNRQGNDIGTQYRSAIFYHDISQKNAAEEFKDHLEKTKKFNSPIVTEIVELNKFYKAENYHHNYYNNNTDKGYCQYVITPKIEKLNRDYSNKLK